MHTQSLPNAMVRTRHVFFTGVFLTRPPTVAVNLFSKIEVIAPTADKLLAN